MKNFASYIGIFIILLLHINCNTTSSADNISQIASRKDSIKKSKITEDFKIIKTPIAGKTYKQTISEIQELKKALFFANISNDSIKNTFTHLLINKIIPFWYGTKWSFEGYSSIPKQGNIACGYFVSTTLQDVGLKINRYKLAQKSPYDEAKILSLGNEITTLQGIPDINQKTLYETLAKGIYFIGFNQSHVGYILKTKKNIFLIHSNYIDSQGVIIEPIETSKVFHSYNVIYIVPLSNNQKLVNKWIQNTKIL